MVRSTLALVGRGGLASGTGKLERLGSRGRYEEKRGQGGEDRNSGRVSSHGWSPSASRNFKRDAREGRSGALWTSARGGRDHGARPGHARDRLGGHPEAPRRPPRVGGGIAGDEGQPRGRRGGPDAHRFWRH